MVRPELLAILECPYCESPKLSYESSDDNPAIVCDRCGRHFPLENNIPLLYRDDDSWAPKAREAAGWVAMWKELDIYEQNRALEPILELPFIKDEPWATVGRMFRAALFQMDLKGGERILDLGAGEGWASQHFAQRGCHAVAMDIFTDPVLGLGRAWKRMARTGTTYDLLVGDSERLPFQPNTFDFVFASNALHHSNNIDQLMRHAYRVLRPGGRLIAIGDPVTTLFQKEQDMTDGDRERAHGIVERRRRFYQYAFTVWRTGFRNIHAEDAYTFWKTNAELYPWLDQERKPIEAQPLLGTTLTTKALTRTMLKLPRPFAVAVLMSLRNESLLMISGQKPT